MWECSDCGETFYALKYLQDRSVQLDRGKSLITRNGLICAVLLLIGGFIFTAASKHKGTTVSIMTEYGIMNKGTIGGGVNTGLENLGTICYILCGIFVIISVVYYLYYHFSMITINREIDYAAKSQPVKSSRPTIAASHFCPHCDTKLRAGAKSCHSCGKPV